MSWLDILSLFGLSYSAAWTPGPNNTLAATFGAKFGFRRSVPHVLGVTIGFPFMVFCIGLGVGVLFQQSNVLREVLRIVGILVLIWFAWKIATSNPSSGTKENGIAKPFTFLQSAAFQWINPKGWVMAISITSAFVDPDAPLLTAGIVAAIFATAGMTSVSGWTVFGVWLQSYLNTPLRWRVFNVAMAVLLLLSVALIASADLL